MDRVSQGTRGVADRLQSSVAVGGSYGRLFCAWGAAPYLGRSEAPAWKCETTRRVTPRRSSRAKEILTACKDGTGFASRRVLVTGGAGFIGSHLVDRLIEHGADVVVIDDLSTSDGSNLSPKARFLKRNLAATNLEDVVADVQYVFHVGAVPRTQYCVENPIECHVVNALGTLRLLDACRQYAKSLKRFVYSSSCAVYGHQVAMPIKEDVRRNHGTPYALQKLIGEQYVCMYATLYGVPGISLIYSNVFGTRRQTEKGAYPNVLAAFSKQKKELGRLLITGDGEQTRDFIHVYDVVDANLKAALSDVGDGSVLNISSGRQTSINAIAGFFDCPVDYIEPRPGEARHLVLDPTKARDILGWSCKISLEEGIKLYFSS